MKTILQINKKDLDLIKSGTKKTEWRQESNYNVDKLFKPRASDGKKDGNPDITEIEFINGYRADSEHLIVQVKRIRLVRFQRDVNIPEDNFRAEKGMSAIEITLGEILK